MKVMSTRVKWFALRRLLLVGLLIGSLAVVVAGEGGGVDGLAAHAYKREPGPYAVKSWRESWHDASRRRDVPVRIYLPAAPEAAGEAAMEASERASSDAAGAPVAKPMPVVLFSHGLGGSREACEYLGEHWASHGYVCVHLQHLGSDRSVWEDVPARRRMSAMRKAAANPLNALHRPRDVRFVIDQIEKENESSDSSLAGRLDLGAIGMAGHSFGAHTTNAVAGMTMVGRRGRTMSFRDPRIKAAIPLSSPVPRNRATLDRAFGSINIPALHMTGTLDESPINDTTAEDRLLPYEHSKGPEKYRIVLQGGDHMVFSGQRLRRTDPQVDTSLDPLFHDLIRMSSTAFWDAYLRGDAKAKAWLQDGGLEAAAGRYATVDNK